MKISYSYRQKKAGTGIERYVAFLVLHLEGQVEATNLAAPDHAGVGKFRRVASLFPKLWFHLFRLGVLVRKSGAELFFAPNHKLPLFLPKSVARVVVVHDMVWRRYPKTMRRHGWLAERIFMPYAVRHADVILSISQSTADDLAHFYPECADKVRVTHLAPCLSERASGKDVHLPDGVHQPYVLFVGTLEPRKNIRRLIQAYAALPGKIRKDYQLVICGGDGWGNVALNDLIDENGLKERVVMAGYVSDAQLAMLYARAHCLAMPSLYEGFGLPLIEAQSCGVPVLTSNISSMPEVAGDGGIIVDPLNVDDICRGLCELLGNTKLRENLAHKARRNAERFSWQKTSRLTLDSFNEALEIRKSKNRSLNEH